MFLPHPRVKVSIVGSLCDREVACSASDHQGSNFESCVWRTVSSQSSHHPQEVLLGQFSLYVHKGGLKPDSFHLLKDIGYRQKNKQTNMIKNKILFGGDNKRLFQTQFRINPDNAYYFGLTMETKGFFQFENIMNVLVNSVRFISLHMLWVYGQKKYFNSFSAGIVFIRLQTSNSDV